MATKVLLLGTSHRDTDGERKIHTALQKFDPSHILVEGSKESHAVNLAAREAACGVITTNNVSDEIRGLLLFEINSLLQDISAVEKYGMAHPRIKVDFLNDEDSKDIGIVVATMTAATESTLKAMQNLNRANQRELVKTQLAEIKRDFSNVKADWNKQGKKPNEAHFVRKLRNGNDPEKINQRDERQWATLEALVESTPTARIATVTGAAHILRTTNDVSLFDRIVASGKFDVTRDMLCFK